MKIKIFNHKKYRILGAVLFITLCGLITSYSVINNSNPNASFKKSYSDKFQGFTAHTEIIKILPLSSIDETILITDTDKTAFLYNDNNSYINNLYNVDYKIKYKNDSFVDISFNLNKKNNLLKINVAGLNQKEKLSLNLNGKNIFENVPVDWSGKLTLETPFPAEKREQSICASIITKNSPQIICHHLSTTEEVA